MGRRFANEEEALDFITDEVVWGNAAGVTKDGEVLRRFAQATMPNVMFGSITMEPRAGNAGGNFYYDEKTGDSLNSWGIPNRGIEAYLPELPEIKKKVNAQYARLWVSISAGNAFSAHEYEEMARMLDKADAADVIEGNMSCPNMIVGGKPKPNVCYDLEAFAAGVRGLSNYARPKKAAVKLAPITEPVILKGLVEACVDCDIDYIVVANTIGNSYIDVYDPGKGKRVPAITMVRGGLAGRSLRPLVKGMIMMIKPWLKGTQTKLIATGGIESGTDAYEYLALGADGFQFNTALTRRNYDPKFVHELMFGEGEHMSASNGLIPCLLEYGLPD